MGTPLVGPFTLDLHTPAMELIAPQDRIFVWQVTVNKTEPANSKVQVLSDPPSGGAQDKEIPAGNCMTFTTKHLQVVRKGTSASGTVAICEAVVAPSQ